MDRNIFREDHHLFRQSFRRFVDREVKPHQERWRAAGIVDREAWRRAGQEGFLCPWLEEEYGGAGGDLIHSVIVVEELAYAYESGFMMSLHSDICVPYLREFGSEEQKQRWLPPCAAGEVVTAIAMTEPGAGSDLAAIVTTAVRDGDHYVLNGSKTLISNGLLCDLCIVAAKTDPNPISGVRGISLFLVEAETPGFRRGKKLAKLGLASQDTAELSFEDCRVPAASLLGREGMGFPMLMRGLQQERLLLSCCAQASAEQVLKDTIAYCKERKAFGAPIAKFQNTQFELAGCAAKIEVGRAFLDRLLTEHLSGASLIKECSIAKLWQAEMLGEVVDACLQLFGGYGYMLEYPVGRAYVDARAQRIYGGTSEIMKIIIAKHLDL